MLRTLGRESMRSALERVRKAAEKDKGMQFTALMHHVYNVDTLRDAYFSLKRKAAPGVDEVTWGQYGMDLEENLQGLSERLKRGAYRARPVCRVHISKEDGRQRPIGIPVLEDKVVQGGSVSPLLANIYLHYVFDLWAHDWRQKKSRGDVVIVRYADDFVVGFQYRDDAERFLKELRDRFEDFGLELHPEKTRLIEFGRFATDNRRKRGERGPETFGFLGFTHLCGKTSKGGFTVKRKTMKKRLQRKRLVQRWLPKVTIYHPFPGQRLRV